ncbi:hypothetical protein NDU88_003680 [Pleurodeles waltl]|uniref:Uncharacterized protein n=1 Tax=Pleurodeles waltl TaxID=8319 RepID=A0AAV7TRA5_PLEWA|nr:hypothetical protein NDU88_003680 [Pleurodeles waltl]
MCFSRADNTLDNTLENCNRVDEDAAYTSEKNCSRGRASSVFSCLDDRGAGVSNVHLDFWVVKGKKREDGLREEEVDREKDDCRQRRDKEEDTLEPPKGSPEGPEPARDTEERRSLEASVETPKRRHVPGGAWLSKVRSLLRDRQFFHLSRDREEEGE